MPEIVYVGGAADGRREPDVILERGVFRVVATVEGNVSWEHPYAIAETYYEPCRLHFWDERQQQSDIITFLRERGMTDAEAVRRLLNGYQRKPRRIR